MTPLESFLALHFGLLLAFSAVGLVVNVCVILFTHPTIFVLGLTKIKSNFYYYYCL